MAVGCRRRDRLRLQAHGALRRHVRYDDDDDCFRVHDMYICIYVSERKAHIYGGQWIDVARPHDGSYGVYDALLLGKLVFCRGHVMPHIDASGQVDLDRPMGNETYVLHLRHALAAVGVPDEEAQQYAAHSLRRRRRHRGCSLRPAPSSHLRHCRRQVNGLARGYMRADVTDRLRASWSLGPKWVLGMSCDLWLLRSAPTRTTGGA